MHQISQSPTDPGFVQDPYPFYDRLRGTGALVHWADYDMPVAASYDAVNTILRDRRFGREQPHELFTPPPPHLAPFYAVEAHSMLELEPPRHTRLRGLVLRAFTSRRIAELGPEITQICDQLIDAFPPAPFDLLPAYATPIPVRIIARLLGVPETLAPDLLRWSNAMVAMYQARRSRATEDAAAQAATEFSDFLRTYIQERRNRPGDDLITHLIAAEEDGAKLSADELITTCILLLNAGHEATVHTVGNGIATLLGQDAPLDWMQPEKIDKTVEEILRFDPPLQLFTRYASERIDLYGHVFERGDQVGCLLGAANRDPDIYADPARFDPARFMKPQLGFGAGLHFCVGAPLARLEISIALRRLFERCPTLRLTRAPRYANLYHFHGLEALEVET